METSVPATALEAARAGDRGSFAQLVEPHLGAVRSFLARMVGQPEDAADLLQETQLRAFTRLSSYRSDAPFKAWLFSIAANLAVDHLRQRKRWRWEAQVKAQEQEQCQDNEQKLAELVGALRDPGLRYDVREHVAFCFTCVGRSLPPDQQAALLLREVFELTNREAAEALGVSESVLRHHLSAARGEMERHFRGTCALVNKAGVCCQCSALREIVPEARRGPEAPALPEGLDARLEIVRRADLVGGATREFHRMLYRRIARYEEEA